MSQLHIEIEPVTMKCRHCDGYGFTSEHDPGCFGNCDGNCPVQVQCEDCHGEGHYITMDWFRKYITALTEKHRAEVEGLRKYVRHSDDCNLEDKYKFLQWCDALHDTPEKDRDEHWLSEYEKYEQVRTTCTCGLDQLLTTK